MVTTMKRWRSDATVSTTSWSFFSQEATKFYPEEMNQKVVYHALKDLAKVEYVCNGGLTKRTESNVLDVIEDISLTLDTAHRLQQSHSNDLGNNGKNRRNNGDKSKGDQTPSNKGGGGGEAAKE